MTDPLPPCEGTGTLRVTAPGKMEGTVTFPVRGEFRVRVERRDPDNATIWVSRPGFAGRAEMAWCCGERFEDPWFFSTFMKIEGYEYQVRIEQDGAVWRVGFLDAVQPVFVEATS